MRYVNTDTYVFLKSIPYSTKAPLVLLMSAFLGKCTFTQSNRMRPMLEIF